MAGCSKLFYYFFWLLVLHSLGSLKINYAIQRWIRSSVHAVSGRQTVMQQNSIEALHQNKNYFILNLLNSINSFSSHYKFFLKSYFSSSSYHYFELLRGCQTNNKIGRFYLPTKSPDKNLSCVMQKSPDFVSWQNRPILSAKIEHVLSLTILSANFSYIGQQILFMLPWWLFTTEDEYLF